MELVLAGDAKIIHQTKEGSYILATNTSNGYPYWKQQDGNNAIWFQKSWHTGWRVGHVDNLGHNYYFGIIGPINITAWPTLISEGYKFYNGSYWQPASGTDVILEDCKFLLLLIPTKVKLYIQFISKAQLKKMDIVNHGASVTLMESNANQTKTWSPMIIQIIIQRTLNVLTKFQLTLEKLLHLNLSHSM